LVRRIASCFAASRSGQAHARIGRYVLYHYIRRHQSIFFTRFCQLAQAAMFGLLIDSP
jgi:hypothetical protein